MFLKRGLIIPFIALLVLSSCSKYQKLMKSTDQDARYEAAMAYYDNKDYYRALQLYQQLVPAYQGTDKAEKMQFNFAYCYFHQKDYIMASYYFDRFAKTYPRSTMAEEAAFMNAYCYFLDSPESSLDQTSTMTALRELQLFIDQHPTSQRLDRCRELMEQLRSKLQGKDMDIANLYYRMGQYEAAITSYNNILRDYPDTRFKEEALYKILRSYYYYAINSITSKKEERFQAALDAYNELMFQYPDSGFTREANGMKADILKRTKQETSQLN